MEDEPQKPVKKPKAKKAQGKGDADSSDEGEDAEGSSDNEDESESDDEQTLAKIQQTAQEKKAMNEKLKKDLQ